MKDSIQKVTVEKTIADVVFFTVQTPQGILKSCAILSNVIFHDPIREGKEIRNLSDFIKATVLAFSTDELNYIRKRINDQLKKERS